MGTLYKHKSTAFNGISKWLCLKFTKSFKMQEIYDLIAEFHDEHNKTGKIFKDKSIYVQNNFQAFRKFAKEKFNP